MPTPLADLQQSAIDYARAGDFGARALEANLELTRAAPASEGAWTRLARCYMEVGQLDEATGALESALHVNPQNTIARNLQIEVTKRRVGAVAPVTPVRSRSRAKRDDSGAAPSGFGRAEFAALGQLAPAAAAEALGPRIEALLMAVNDRPFAAKAVETRNRAGQSGSRLYRRNSFHAASAGYIDAFQHGGRWEPQLNIGFLSGTPWGRDAARAGIGFNLTQGGADASREAGQERVLAAYAQFQQLVSAEWRVLLTEWMTANAGFIQHADRPPATDLMPKDALSWLINCQHPAEEGWIFCGRWLFADVAADAAILGDSKKLLTWIEGTFKDLLPLWTSLYRA